MYPSRNVVARSDENTQGQQSRTRTPRACDSCYKKKIKCDAAHPQCNWCSHHDIPCTFDRVVQRKRRDKGNSNFQKTSRLAERISRIEKLLTENLLRDPAPSQSPSSSDFNLPENPTSSSQSPLPSSHVALHFAGRELGAFSLLTGIPFLFPEGERWIESRTGQQISLDKLSHTRPPWEKQRALNSNALLSNTLTQKMFELPDRQIVEVHFDMFLSSVMHRIFPVLDPFLFRETIKAAYQQSNLNHYGKASIRACVLSFIALSSVLQPPDYKFKPVDLPPIDSEAFATKAQSLLPQILQENTTIDGLEAVTMLALFELVSGNLRSANYYTSIASRFIFLLGGNICPYMDMESTRGQDLQSRKQRHIRNLFWLCYTVEKDIALRSGQPQVLSDDNCDLTLPPGYVEQLYTSMDIHHHSQELPENPLFPIDLRLSIIKSRAGAALYSSKALRKSDAELLKDIRELDDELERWRMSVPQEWRPTLSFSYDNPDPNVSMHSVILRLNYHLCMTLIHSASSRCKSWDEGQGGIMEGVSSSLALSVEASRSTLLYLEAAEHVLVDGIFWTLIFYPMSALIVLFCNILENPSDPQATKDLGLLQTAISMMERVFLRQIPSVNEVVHIKLIADFVTELHRLGMCAIERTWNAHDG